MELMKDFKQPLLILTPLASITYSQSRLRIINKENPSIKNDYPIRKISSVSVYAPSSLTAYALNILLRLKIPCHFFSYYGKFLGRICSSDSRYEKSVLILGSHKHNMEVRLDIAKYLMSKKARCLCMEYGDRLQKSVYFFRVNQNLINKLFYKLNEIIDENTDQTILLQLKYSQNNFKYLGTLIDISKFVI
jgi:CRISPR-associated endonuclease Cas2